MKEIPSQLKLIISERRDLNILNYLDQKNERKLVVWLILHGFDEYPNIKEGDIYNNEILRWIASGTSNRYYKNIPRIILGIWDIFNSHKRRWPFPHLNTYYQFWLKKNWKSMELDLPNYEGLFHKKFSNLGNLSFLIYEILWIIRKPISLKTKKYFGFDLDYYFANKLHGFQIQMNVVDALVYRELKTRVSQVRFGVIGVFVEPIGVMAIFLGIFSIIRANRGPLDLILFLASGIVLFTLFNDIAIRCSNGMTANEALFFYKPVKPIDTVIARAIVEAGLYAIVFIVIILSTYLIRQEIIISDISLLFQAYIALVLFSFGVGLFLLIATFIYPSIIQLIPLAMRPIWFLSGVFISLNALPQWLRPYLSWNPIFQAIEITRHSFSQNYILDKSLVSISYLWTCSVISCFTGLLFYSTNEKRLLTR